MNSDNLVGITLGNRYDMLEKIGTGGMATVYKAKDTLLKRYVAIKILRDSLEGEEQVVSNFIKEAQSSASLVHNNIVSVYDVGEENGLNYMVMEYVDGITLKEYIKQKGALPWQEACDFAIQIGQGISEAHSINIIHRDIKPQNILMTKDKTLLREKLPLSAEVLWVRYIIFHLNRQEADLRTQEVIYIHLVLCFTKCLPEKFLLTVILL